MADPTASGRWGLFSRLTLFGTILGCLVGLGEAALLRRVPHVPALLKPDVNDVIWFLAPLVSMGIIGIVGAGVGLLASLRTFQRPTWTTRFIAVFVGVIAAYILTALWLFHVREGSLVYWRNLAPVLLGFGLGSCGILLGAKLAPQRAGRAADWLASHKPGVLGTIILLAAVACTLGVALYPALSPSKSTLANAPRAAASPNIVLITLDTVRADHLSAYGYSRLTTPHLDRLAGQGVLFESAMTVCPWTLGSHASMFTGLLPHQHGANWAVPLAENYRTLAEILKSQGYETAGFTSNFYYGQDGWGMGQGFETYKDDSTTRRHNFAATLVGRGLIQPLYQHLVHYDMFDRRNARELNADVFEWFERRSSRPFFLFINYFDAHDPYLAGSGYDARFGRISRAMVKQVNSMDGVRVPKTPSSENQASLIAGYDNCLAFLDEQVGSLMEFLRRSQDRSNTIVIITSDHGEGFGEHGRYGHGWNVNREAIHVPLIIVGAGVPSGLRVAHLARTSEMFPTVLDLALGDRLPLSRISLRRFWTPGFKPEPFDDFVISETMENTPAPEPSVSIGLMTSQWHYIHDRTGQEQMYQWRSDPAEEVNLAASTPDHEALLQLRKRLGDCLRDSARPWKGPAYLFALDGPGYSFLREIAFAPRQPAGAADTRPHIGAVQSLFPQDVPTGPDRPPLNDKDLMKSLPYQ